MSCTTCHNTVPRQSLGNLTLPGCTLVCYHVIDRFPHDRYLSQYFSWFNISFLPLICSWSGPLYNAPAQLVQAGEAILDLSRRLRMLTFFAFFFFLNLTWYLKSKSFRNSSTSGFKLMCSLKTKDWFPDKVSGYELVLTIVAYGLSSTLNQMQIVSNMLFLNWIFSVHLLAAVHQSCSEQ